MDRFEHCMVEFYWAAPVVGSKVHFKPSFSVFHSDGRRESHSGSNPELAILFTELGKSGWRISSAVTASNWILWTLERALR